MTVRILHGDCLDILPTLDAESISAVITDPPYGIGFMGREWDSFSPSVVASDASRRRRKGTLRESERWPEKNGKEGARSQGGGVSITYDTSLTGNQRFQWWCQEWAVACFRVLKPGAHLVAFSGSRTFHRMTCGIEDAGFEIRDCLIYLYGSGFPKSLDFAAEPDRRSPEEKRLHPKTRVERLRPEFVGTSFQDGWGTALKPGWEPIVLARKPFRSTVAANVAAHGTGAINIGACRLESNHEPDGRDGEASADRRYTERGSTNFAPTPGPRGGAADGRWPANVVLDEAAAASLDAQTGHLQSGTIQPWHRANGVHGTALRGSVDGSLNNQMGHSYGDAGGASRFFFVAKPDSSTYNTEDKENQQCGEKSTTDVSTSVGKKTGNRSDNLQTDGSGSRQTDLFQTGTKSTIETKTRSTTISPTLNASQNPGTTTTTNESERIIESLTVSRSDDASDAASTEPLTNSRNGAPEPTRGIASNVLAPISESGERETESTTTPICASIDGIAANSNRFFYTAKASRTERNRGLAGMPERKPHDDEPNGRAWDIPGSHSTARANHHPTVKPLDLMQWLVRLVTPPGGVVLDLFAGSGTTGVAADREGFDAILIEREAEYIPIIEARLIGDAPMFAEVETETAEALAKRRQEQMELPMLRAIREAEEPSAELGIADGEVIEGEWSKIAGRDEGVA